ncbi:MAG: hypothetical protein JO131_10285, partial [Gammaproteobacteria bacterium]|nr:hypothetical protein [Gammaproteobacteria bacterium]
MNLKILGLVGIFSLLLSGCASTTHCCQYESQMTYTECGACAPQCTTTCYKPCMPRCTHYCPTYCGNSCNSCGQCGNGS